MDGIRQQELNTRGPYARDTLFLTEYPREGEGFAPQPVEHVLYNLTGIFNTADDVLQFMTLRPEEGPGSGKRVSARLHCYLPAKGVDLVVILEEGQPEASAALVSQEGQTIPVDGQAAEELPLIERLRALNLVLEGVLNTDQPEALQGIFEEAVSIEPAYPLLPEVAARVALHLGEVEWGVGKLRELEQSNPEAAGPVLQKLIEEQTKVARDEYAASPKDATVMNRLGFLLMQQEQFEEALAIFNEAMAIDPAQEKGHANTIIGLLQLGRHQDALQAFTTARERFGDDAPMISWLSDILAQQLLAEMPPHEAEPLIRAHCLHTPGMLHAMAAAYAELEAAAAAEERLEELLELTPGDPRAHYNLGVLSEDPEELVRRCRLALLHDPGYEPARLALPKAVSVRDQRNQDLVAENVEAAFHYTGSHGREITLNKVPVAAEFVFSLLIQADEAPDLVSDKWLHLLLAAKGQNRKFETSEGGKYVEILVNEPPAEEFLMLAGALAWETPGGEQVLSAPVAVILLDHEKKERVPLVTPHNHILRLERLIAAEGEGLAEMDWPYEAPAPRIKLVNGSGGDLPPENGPGPSRFGFPRRGH